MDDGLQCKSNMAAQKLGLQPTPYHFVIFELKNKSCMEVGQQPLTHGGIWDFWTKEQTLESYSTTPLLPRHRT